MVPKKDGSWLPCGSYRRLNLVTTPDKYPLPKMQDLSNSLHGCTIFKKLILSRVITKSLSRPRTPQKLNYNAIWLVWVFVHSFWAVQCCTNFSKNDGSHHRWSGRCVCIYWRLMCWFSGQANTPPPSGGFFHNFSRQWPSHQFGKMCFCNTFSWDSLAQDFGDGSGPYNVSLAWYTFTVVFCPSVHRFWNL